MYFKYDVLQGSCPGIDYSLDSSDPNQDENHDGNQIVDYMLNNPQPSNFCSGSSSFDKLSFADVMQFADFGNKLGTNQAKSSEDETGIDPVYFLKFPVLNDKLQLDHDQQHQLSLMAPQLAAGNINQDMYKGFSEDNDKVVEVGKNNGTEAKSKRKRPRTIKTSEEVESQRMTHIAVERNRRKQMNEHLRVLRSLMPSSYVQRVINQTSSSKSLNS